jgi:CubicO group peptidase (beta-lactamase class C family)
MKISVVVSCQLVLILPFVVFAQDDELGGLDGFIEEAMKEYGVPGASVVVVKDKAVVYSKGFGVRKIGSDLKVDEDTVFQLASVTKTFTAASVGVAVDQGLVEFDKPVVDVIPHFALHDPYPTRYTTARDLLSHRTGLPAFTGDLFDHLGYSREEVVERIRFIEPACSFREEANYSNIGFFLAGETAAKATGSRWEELVRASLLGPLGMTRSGFTDSIEADSNAAFPHGVFDGETRAVPYNKQGLLVAAGAMTSTASDMGHYMMMLLDGGKYEGTQVLSAETVGEIMTPVMVEEPGFAELPPISAESGFDYGLAWGIFHWKSHRILEKGGALDGMRSITVLVPELGLGVTVLANMNLTVLPEAVRAYVLEQYLGDAEYDMQAKIRESSKKIAEMLSFDPETLVQNPHPPSLKLAGYAGIYENELYGKFTVVLSSEGSLRVQAGPAQYTGVLDHVNYDTFHLHWPILINLPDEVNFVIDAKGKVREMITESFGKFRRGNSSETGGDE